MSRRTAGRSTPSSVDLKLADIGSAARQGFSVERFMKSLERQGARLDGHARELFPADRSIEPEKVLGSIASRTALNRRQVYRAFADGMGLPFVDMSWIRPDGRLLALLPMKEWRRFRAFPLAKIGNTIEVAFADLQDLQLPMLIEQQFGLQVSRMCAVPEQIDEYLALEMVDAAEVQSALAALSGDQLQRFAEQLVRGENSGIGPFVAQVVALAKKWRSSDVHIEPMEADVRVRLRIDGLLRECLVLDHSAANAIVSFLKVTAGLDIAERRLPQDGRMNIGVGGAMIDMRLSTVPTVYGEKVCLRLIDNSTALLSLDELSFSKRMLPAYRELLKAPHGLILVTGPTGSGKTTTLYASLSEIADPSRNITTIEDPVEYRLGGINQIQVYHKIGLDFPRILRSVLRQDPDVILVGEIRDGETARIATQAALTGHLVFSTLHTNSAPETVVRLADMGVPGYLIAQALLGVMGQRLVRRLCEHCRQPFLPDAELRKRLGLTGERELTFFAPQGCKHCSFVGYQGRLPVQELLVMDNRIREAVSTGKSSVAWLAHAWERGYRPLSYDCLIKALSGLTSAEEVLRVHESREVPE